MPHEICITGHFPVKRTMNRRMRNVVDMASPDSISMELLLLVEDGTLTLKDTDREAFSTMNDEEKIGAIKSLMTAATTLPARSKHGVESYAAEKRRGLYRGSDDPPKPPFR